MHRDRMQESPFFWDDGGKDGKLNCEKKAVEKKTEAKGRRQCGTKAAEGDMGFTGVAVSGYGEA
eukprot:scaffold17210_cov69-Attheya_sp.AAC.3